MSSIWHFFCSRLLPLDFPTFRSERDKQNDTQSYHSTVSMVGQTPWKVFWGSILLYLVFSVIALGALYRPSDFVGRIIFLLLAIVWILSISRVVLITWQRSKIVALIAVAVAAPLLFVGMLPYIGIEQYATLRRRGYDADVRVHLKTAAYAEEAYYKVNGTYTANIDSLTRLIQSANVTITVEATATTFVITGTAQGCKPDTGTWSFNSTTGENRRDPCRWR